MRTHSAELTAAGAAERRRRREMTFGIGKHGAAAKWWERRG